jgi:hypothetical protein
MTTVNVQVGLGIGLEIQGQFGAKYIGCVYVDCTMLLTARKLLLRAWSCPNATLNTVKPFYSLRVTQPLYPISHRTYASKAKSHPKSTASLVPSSQQPLTDESARQEYGRAEDKMQTTLEWFRKECAALETRASGRVTPALLDSVRIQLPGSKDGLVRLDEVATVGVRDGSTLLLTLFDEHVSTLSSHLRFSVPSHFHRFSILPLLSRP